MSSMFHFQFPVWRRVYLVCFAVWSMEVGELEGFGPAHSQSP